MEKNGMEDTAKAASFEMVRFGLREQHTARHDEAASKVLGGTNRETLTHRKRTENAPETAPEPAPQLNRKGRCGNKECDMDCDTVEPAFGGFLEVILRSGWRGLFAVAEIASVKPRGEGGCAIFLKRVDRPILVDVAIEHVIDAIEEGAADGTT
jgi:hypothetical protein